MLGSDRQWKNCEAPQNHPQNSMVSFLASGCFGAGQQCSAKLRQKAGTLQRVLKLEGQTGRFVGLRFKVGKMELHRAAGFRKEEAP